MCAKKKFIQCQSVGKRVILHSHMRMDAVESCAIHTTQHVPFVLPHQEWTQWDNTRPIIHGTAVHRHLVTLTFFYFCFNVSDVSDMDHNNESDHSWSAPQPPRNAHRVRLDSGASFSGTWVRTVSATPAM